jgi:hypothetical protein
VGRDPTVQLLQKGDEFHLAFAWCDSRIDMAAARVESIAEQGAYPEFV